MVKELGIKDIKMNSIFASTGAQGFPLYDVIVNTTQNVIPLSIIEQKELISKIKLLDTEGRGMIFVILRIHSLRNTKSKLLDLPYKAQKISEKIDGVTSEVSTDLKFNMTDFPSDLQQMISQFVTLHLRKQEEDIIKPG